MLDAERQSEQNCTVYRVLVAFLIVIVAHTTSRYKNINRIPILSNRFSEEKLRHVVVWAVHDKKRTSDNAI